MCCLSGNWNWYIIRMPHLTMPTMLTRKQPMNDPTSRQLLEGFLEFSGRYRILGYNGSQFSQLGTTYYGQLTFKF